MQHVQLRQSPENDGKQAMLGGKSSLGTTNTTLTTSLAVSAELAEQKNLVRSMKVDREMDRANLRCKEQIISQLTEQYRDALGQV